MVHVFAIELFWIFIRPEERHGFPATITATALPSHTNARCFKNGYFGTLLSPVNHLVYVLFDRPSR